MSTPIQYSIDPSTNPATWPGPDQVPGDTNISKVNVIFVNINPASDFQMLRTGTNKSHHALIQVAQHVSRGLYRIISLNITEYSCVVVMSTENMRSELLKNGFPWDIEENAQPKDLSPASIIALPTTPNQILYSIDLSTNPNPARWHGESGFIDMRKVRMIFHNTNTASDFLGHHTGTNEHVHHALIQVARHVARGLYYIVSLSITEDSCMVFMSTEKPRSELMWKNGFPWDIEENA
ncbi:uncharacterized protein LY79DRAFT_562331 [Colletotrichum navitas]|uniref:Uncharacterized protein n=1 Tax=Colletotrichum navitas TaxID=681940 RepID=A0AAD8PU68_9PEZI|nr:uncharacterized protein LY79DRAFT_562331 [Colletotrichum navitas]KAK1580108.1 hypothetical protein LY79DRAFT_562331 [Colletotrichum navitas]